MLKGCEGRTARLSGRLGEAVKRRRRENFLVGHSQNAKKEQEGASYLMDSFYHVLPLRMLFT